MIFFMTSRASAFISQAAMVPSAFFSGPLRGNNNNFRSIRRSRVVVWPEPSRLYLAVPRRGDRFFGCNEALDMGHTLMERYKGATIREENVWRTK